MSSLHYLRASGEAAMARGLRSNSQAAASGPLEATCEEALDGRPEAGCRATGADASCGRAAGIVAPGAVWQEACGADDASPSLISALSARIVCSTT